MVRIVGGIILMKIGFQCFFRRPSRGGVIPATDVGQDGSGCNRDNPWTDIDHFLQPN